MLGIPEGPEPASRGSGFRNRHEEVLYYKSYYPGRTPPPTAREQMSLALSLLHTAWQVHRHDAPLPDWWLERAEELLIQEGKLVAEDAT